MTLHLYGTNSAQAHLCYQHARFPCLIGSNGITTHKHEGDHALPVGIFPLRYVLWRRDHLRLPPIHLPHHPITRTMGWCDDPRSPHYNRLITLPCRWRAERLWREDTLYDIIVVLGINDSPAHKKRGSALFLHLTTPTTQTTQGCIACAPLAMCALLPRLHRWTKLYVHHPLPPSLSRAPNNAVPRRT